MHSTKMKAIVCTKYGPPEVLQLKEVEKPVPKKNEVLIKIHATAVTASDCIARAFNIPYNHWFPKGMFMELLMGLVLGFGKPRNPVMGMVLSGKIESRGKNVQRFKQGDQVFGWTLNSGLSLQLGTYAEYKCLPQNSVLAKKPANMDFKEAAAIPYGGLIALHYIRKGKIQPGYKVLIYGASGAIGTAAVQIAKHLGAHVTGICSTRNLELVRSLGADKVIDYTAENPEDEIETYDFILDAVGKRKQSELKTYCESVLNPKGRSISVDDGSPKADNKGLSFLKQMVETGDLKPVIDSSYPLEEMVDAHRYVDQGHKQGNVIITIDHKNDK